MDQTGHMDQGSGYHQDDQCDQKEQEVDRDGQDFCGKVCIIRGKKKKKTARGGRRMRSKVKVGTQWVQQLFSNFLEWN